MAYEDFTGFTEFDEGSDITVDSATKVSWLNLVTRKETGYLYRDKGVNHFSGDFTHKFEMQFSSMGEQAFSCHWMLSNIVDDVQGVVTGSGIAQTFIAYDDAETLFLRVFEAGSQLNDSWAAPGPQLSTTYFVEIVRDDDGGANSTGRITAYIRTGSHAGALQDTLVLDCSVGQQNDFRYVYAIATNDSSSIHNGLATGFTQNFDLGEATSVNAGNVESLSQITAPASLLTAIRQCSASNVESLSQITAPASLLTAIRQCSASNVESLSQITAPASLLTAIRQCSASNVESLSQITAPTIERGLLNSPDIPCNTEVTVPSFTVKRSLSIPDIEGLSQVTAPSISDSNLNANDLSCSTEITVPSFTVKREIAVPNIESSSEVGIPAFDKQTLLNASDISSLTEVTAAGIYKELFPQDIECSSEVEAADLEYIMVGRMNATLPMITAEMSGGHGGFLSATLPMMTAEMRGGAHLDATIPMITAEIIGNVGINGTINATLPMITAEITGRVETLGQLNATLPMIVARMVGTAGHVGQLNATIPMITAQLAGYIDIAGQLNATIPMIEAYLTGTNDRFATCDVLRYEEPELE